MNYSEKKATQKKASGQKPVVIQQSKGRNNSQYSRANMSDGSQMNIQQTNRKKVNQSATAGRMLFVLIAYVFIMLICAGIFYLCLHIFREAEKLPPIKEMSEASANEFDSVISGISETELTEAKVTETKAEETEAVALPEEPENYKFDFLADLSAYEEYMNPSDRDTYLTLINTKNTLSSDYIPDDLAEIENTRAGRTSKERMRECAVKALEALFLEAAKNGITDVSVTSGYRSYDYQTQLYEAKVAQFSYLGEEEARIKAATIVTYPGASEHQSGLCVDMHNLPAADVSFAEKEAAKWLADNCFKFGFILRYPENKTDITGISYEPWHFRFVGRYHAVKMHELDMCLEEYTEYLSSLS